jgi:hypothetical protein
MIPPERQNGRAHRVAITDDDPQPHQAAQPPDRHREGLKQAPGADTAAQVVSAITAGPSGTALTPTPRPLSDSLRGKGVSAAVRRLGAGGGT